MKSQGWLLWQVCFATLVVEASSAKLQSNPVSRWLHFFGRSKLCPSNCHEPQGLCINGECQCHEGFSGKMCEVKMMKASEHRPANDALGALARARASTEALRAPLPSTPVEMAADRARRIAAAADLSSQEPG
eukprot:symbB.v1.2.002113.t1/scaffold106.1/size366728/1